MIKFLSLPFYIKLTCTLVSIIALGYIAYIGQTIIVPFVLGSLLALLLVPVCNWLERKLKLYRTLAAILALLLFFGLVGGLFIMLGSQLSMLKDDWPAFERQIINGTHVIQVWVHHTFGVAQSEQVAYITENISKSISQGTAIVGLALVSLSSLVVLFVFTFLYTFFMLIYRGHVVRFLLLLNRTEHHEIVLDIVHQIQYVVKKYLMGLVLQMFIVATLTFVALNIVGVKYSLMLSLITGVFNVLPYIGIFISILVISLITFATSSITHVLFVVVALVIVHLIDSNFIVPKVVGSKVKINSLFAMVAIIIGEMLWGISGMFLAIPMLAICKILFDRVYDLKAWGFLLGEEEKTNENFKKLLEELNIFKQRRMR